MKTVTLIKNIYVESIRNLGHFLLKRYFQIFSWFSFCLFFIVLYAFVYRVFTGFPFD